MEEMSTVETLLRALGSLALVLALIGLVAWVARRFLKPQNWGWAGQGIRVTQQLPLGVRKKLLVVECEGRRFLVGVGKDQVCAIGDLPQVASPAAPAHEVSHA